ncbi:MAG: trypsin-like peptidase domain-containing protein [Gammaproteobacteria bacterium]|nr:trypsin-like peptidase domain-containing protein [Gammaproteobacteria bacterium]
MRLIFRLALALLLPSVAVAGSHSDREWRGTLERISSGVVSIKVDSTRAFDTEWNQSSQATGFVVDAERGLILTNRHVVTPGPVRAEALFNNQEEVELVAVYRDPVHDFGFYRYDPSQLKYIQPVELKLDPAAAQIGREIQVVGNDAGERLSFLSGTLARLDRPAPSYGRGNYNDFNTFYLQAASGTSGGSSGSPVVDIEGNVVALNAGANSQAASSFFLPLDRVQRVLESLQAGEEVTRGTLETVFVHLAFDELRRLGLRDVTEADIRSEFPGQTGMLVVDEIIPQGVADGVLQVGDIIVEVNGEFVTSFVPLAAILDGNVGDTISLVVERYVEVVDVEVSVQDLAAITPREFISFGDAVVHELSYQQARHVNQPIEGIYVANPGYVLANASVPRGAVITSVGETQIATLDEFEKALAELADRERATLRFYNFEDPVTSKLAVMTMDRRWFPAERCVRNDDSGLWPCVPLQNGGAAEPQQPATATYIKRTDRRARTVAPSLVLVNYDMPYTISGISDRHYYGTGVIVDAERGFVVVDRNTVPEAMGDVRITFAGELEVQASVRYIHSTHNLALLEYDPALIGETPVRAARLATELPRQGESVWVIGLRPDHKLIQRQTEVASVDPAFLPLSRTMRFRDTNLEVLHLVNGPADVDGVIVDKQGRMTALWSSFAFQVGQELVQENKGVPAEQVAQLLELVRDDRPLYSLEVELSTLSLATARKLGLDDDSVRRLTNHDPERRQALVVLRTVTGAPSADVLKPGDLILTIDGNPVTRFREVEVASRSGAVEVEFFRDGKLQIASIETVALDGRGVRRAVMWAGALLQAPYRDMSAQRGVEPVGVYVSYFAYGSPASRFGLFAGRRIVEVDGIATPNLDRFLEVIENKADRQSVLLTTVTWNGAVDVLTLKLDKTYWPTYEVVYRNDEWQRIAFD